MQEVPEGDKTITFNDFPETGGACNKVMAGPLPVALIPRLDHALLHLKPKAEGCFHLADSYRLEILGVVCSWFGLLELLCSQVSLVAQESPEIGDEKKLEEGECSALVVDVDWDVSYVVLKEMWFKPGHFLLPACVEILSGVVLWLRVAPIRRP